MTIQTIIASDITDIFTVEGNTPLSVQAVYTAPGGAAETAVTVFYSNTPLHGDEQQNYPVEGENIAVVGKTSSVSGWVIRGTVAINSIDYEVAEYPFPTDSYWATVMLRTSTRNKTKI